MHDDAEETSLLLRFEVANHRSIMSPVELSMIAVDDDRPATRGFDRLPERVLTVAGIYGPNASGKSNVLEGLRWVAAAVDQSLRQWRTFVPREPFRFADGPASSITFEVDMMIGEVRYTYFLEVNDDSVTYEALHSYPERRRRMLFEREEQELTLRRGLSALSGVRELLTPTTLALSAALRFDDPEVGPFGHALAGVANVNFRRLGGFTNPIPSALSLSPTTRMLFEANETGVVDERVIAMLKLADLGIDDIEIVHDDTDPATGRAAPRLRLVHSAVGERLPFDIAQESTGTRTWLALIGPVLNALRTGQILLFDEIDASLHPHLSAYLLTLFQDPDTNPHGAQLIFSTHDTSLLSHLNRDEVWLTDKGDDGATRLTALAEYGGDKVRRSTNLERAYLQGRFGAVPFIDQVTVRHALGLSA